jgi:RNA polymerase-binding transcription factor DksA
MEPDLPTGEPEMPTMPTGDWGAPTTQWDAPAVPVVVPEAPVVATDLGTGETGEEPTGEQSTAEHQTGEQSAGENPAGEEPTGEHSTGEQQETPALSIDEVEQLLDEVEAALSRLDDETYGQCSSCGERIDDSLLTVEPTRQTCEVCALTPAAGVAP